jgi:hypothetical protein
MIPKGGFTGFLTTKEDAMAERIPTVRISPDNHTALQNLGLLKDLAGNWHGYGFNLVARPAFEFNQNLFLELNLTDETLKFDPISSSIPNRGTFRRISNSSA